MDDWLTLVAFGLSFGVLLIVLTRYQASRHQRYLSQNNEQSSKMIAGQRELISQQERKITIAERQVAVLERIAIALEQKRP